MDKVKRVRCAATLVVGVMLMPLWFSSAYAQEDANLKGQLTSAVVLNPVTLSADQAAPLTFSFEAGGQKCTGSIGVILSKEKALEARSRVSGTATLACGEKVESAPILMVAKQGGEGLPVRCQSMAPKEGRCQSGAIAAGTPFSFAKQTK